MGTRAQACHSRVAGYLRYVMDAESTDTREGRACDVLVIGGGPAGLTAAVTLARARRRVTVVDDGHPRNAAAHGVRGFLSRDGMSPQALIEEGKREVASYGGVLVDGRVTSLGGVTEAFDVELASGETWRARHVIVATGLIDVLPDIDGILDRWGQDVLHCPYCHGWEHADQRLGLIASSPHAVDEALLLRQWSHAVTLLCHETTLGDTEDRDRLDRAGISVVTGRLSRLIVDGDALRGVEHRDGTRTDLDALFVMPVLEARADVVAALDGLPQSNSVGRALTTDDDGRTEIPGVWAVGNVVDLAAQVVVAAAAGLKCAVAVNADLVRVDRAP